MSVEESTHIAESAHGSAPHRRGSRFGTALRRVMRFLGMVVALAATVALAVGVFVVGPNIEEWRGTLPTLNEFGYPDSDDVRVGEAMGWAEGKAPGRRPAAQESGDSGGAHRFLAPAKGAAPWPGHWCSADTIGYRIDLSGARMAGMNPETELRRWENAFEQWAQASEGKYKFQYRGESKLPLVMNSSLEDMKISDSRLDHGEIAITYATSRSDNDPRWSDYLHAGLGPSLAIGGIGPVIWGAGVSGSGLITTGTIILDAHDVASLDGSLPTVYVHESGHALGLAHVKNPNQMMYENAPDSARIGKGDRAGIQKLAAAACE